VAVPDGFDLKAAQIIGRGPQVGHDDAQLGINGDLQSQKPAANKGRGPNVIAKQRRENLSV
jgi:hypothetical protein